MCIYLLYALIISGAVRSIKALRIVCSVIEFRRFRINLLTENSVPGRTDSNKTPRRDHITEVLIDLHWLRNEVENFFYQSVLKEIRRGIHDSSEDELILILGDFNAHLGIIGDQDVHSNGRIVLDMMTEDNMLLLNDTEKCKGIYTWERGDQKVSLILYL